jgi:hypothetical protein
MSFERSVRRRIRRADAVEVGRASQTAGECGAEWERAREGVPRGCAWSLRGQGKSVGGGGVLWGMAMLECRVGGVYRSVGRNQSLDGMAWPDEQWTRWTAGGRRRRRGV